MSFIRRYTVGTNVTITAPVTAGGTYQFYDWEYDNTHLSYDLGALITTGVLNKSLDAKYWGFEILKIGDYGWYPRLSVYNNTIYIIGEDWVDGNSCQFVLYKSTDNGDHWTNSFVNPDNSDVITEQQEMTSGSIKTISDDIIYLSYNHKDMLSIVNRMILFTKSINGGSTWSTPVIVEEMSHPQAVNYGYTNMCCPDANNIFIFYNYIMYIVPYYYFKFAKSIDGGATWVTSTIYNPSFLDNAYMDSDAYDSNRVACVFREAVDNYTEQLVVEITTDGGSNFTKKIIETSPYAYIETALSSRIKWVDSTTIYIVSKMNSDPLSEIAFYKSTNSGVNWTKTVIYSFDESLDNSDDCIGLHVVDANTIYVLNSLDQYDDSSNSGFAIYKSINAGATWSKIYEYYFYGTEYMRNRSVSACALHISGDKIMSFFYDYNYNTEGYDAILWKNFYVEP